MVAMRDGVKLATDVYIPEGIEKRQKLPTILIRTCYDRNGKKEFLMRWVNKGCTAGQPGCARESGFRGGIGAVLS